MRILAIKWRRLGDTILWTSALRALQQAFPEASIDLAYPQPYQRLFEHDSRWAKQFLLRGDTWTAQRDSLLTWRRERYDWVLNFHASHRSLMLSLLSGARRRLIHHHSRKPKNFFSQARIIHLGEPMAAVERDLNVIRTLGWQGPAPETKIYCGDFFRDEALRQLKAAGWNAHDPLFVLAPEASRLAKAWPMASYLALASRLKPYGFVVMVESSEKRLAPYARDEVSAVASILATPDLGQLMGLISWASVWVGSDSGAKHLACALGVRTVTLFGPESIAEWHFYPKDRHRVIQKYVRCRDEDPEPPKFAWCGESVCPLASHACLQTIFPGDVSQQVLQMLE